MPDKALKSVLLPVFGFPIKATRAGRELAERIEGEGTVTAIPRNEEVSIAGPRSSQTSRPGCDFDYTENSRRSTPTIKWRQPATRQRLGWREVLTMQRRLSRKCMTPRQLAWRSRRYGRGIESARQMEPSATPERPRQARIPFPSVAKQPGLHRKLRSQLQTRQELDQPIALYSQDHRQLKKREKQDPRTDP